VVRNHVDGTSRSLGSGRPNGDSNVIGEWTRIGHVRTRGITHEDESQERRKDERFLRKLNVDPVCLLAL